MSSSCPELSEANQDRISNLPDIATDKILKCLPLKMAAKMSVLSRKWKDKWLSHKHLVFDAAFWEEQNVHGGFNVSWIISNVLFYHNGPLYKFHLHIPKDAVWIRMCLSQWLSFISRTCVKKIALTNWVVCKTLPSHIFACKELVKLRLVSFVLNPPPSDFKGFGCLRCLELCQMEFKTDFFGSLIASCPRLAVLRLDRCIGLDSVIIDAPSLESLVIEGGFNNLSFKNAVRLTNISICLDEKMYPKGITVLPYLATSCELQYLHFDGHFCKVTIPALYNNVKTLQEKYVLLFLFYFISYCFGHSYSFSSAFGLICKFFAGGLKDSIPVVFNHLSKLALTELDLGHFTVFRRVMAIIHSCPCIKDLEISVSISKNVPNFSSLYSYTLYFHN